MKFLICAVAVVALGAIAQASPFFGDSFFDNNQVFSQNSQKLSAADRLRDQMRNRNRFLNRDQLAAKSADGARLSFDDLKQGEEYFKSKDLVEFNQDHAQHDSSKFALQVIDEKDHKEQSSVNFRQGSTIDTGSRFKSNTALDTEQFNNQEVKAASETQKENEAAKDFFAESNFKFQNDDFFKAAQENGFEKF